MEQTSDPASTPSTAAVEAREDDEWLVELLVFVFRAFLAFIVAFAKAIIIVSQDPDIRDGFLSQGDLVQQAQSTSSSEIFQRNADDRRSPGTAHAQQTATRVASDVAEYSTQSEIYYVITTGLDIGITTNRTVATSLTDGVPMNAQLECDSRSNAISAYLASLRSGDVRRMRARTLPSGEIERTIEFLDHDGAVRDLDKELAVGGAAVLRALSGAKLDFPDRSMFTTDESDDGLVMPSSHFNAMHSLLSGASSSWTQVSTDGRSDDFTQVSTNPSTSFAPVSNLFPRVIVLDSDEDSSDISRGDISVNVTEGAHEIESTHSSDKYYNSSMESLIAEHVRKEDEVLGLVSPSDSPTN